MRNKAVLLVLVLWVAACGGGAAKDEFERYEKALNPLLEQDAKLRARSDQQALDVSYFGNESEFRKLIDRKLTPFYARMAKEAAAVEPKGEELKEVHRLLENYIALKQRTYATLGDLDAQVKKVEALERPAGEKFEKVYQAMPGKLAVLRESLGAAPEMQQKLAPLFAREAQVGREVLGAVEQLRRGAMPAAAFLKLLDEQAMPFYRQLREDVNAVETEGAGKKAIDATIQYVIGYLDLLSAAREIALARSESEVLTRTLQEDLQRFQMEAMEMLKAYREDAKAYRDSLR